MLWEKEMSDPNLVMETFDALDSKKIFKIISAHAMNFTRTNRMYNFNKHIGPVATELQKLCLLLV